MAIQQFVHFYGAGHFYQPLRWRTHDGVIPFKRFWLEHAAIRNVRAVERLNLIEAVKIGTRLTQALTEAGQTKIDALLEKHFDEAYPQDRTTDAPEG